MVPRDGRAGFGMIAALLGLIWFAAPVAALSLDFPGEATPTATKSETLASYRLPVGPWAETGMDTHLTEGSLTQSAWRIAAPGITTLELMAPLRDQLAAAGFHVLFECETAACGGFDFRYGMDVLPEPEMHVDLGDYRFLAAERTVDGQPEVISLLVSRSSENGFVQMIRCGAQMPTPAIVSTSTKSPTALSAGSATSGFALTTPVTPVDLGAQLETGGAIALDDLNFPTGSSTLEAGSYASLAALAGYLIAHPDRQVALVGHTDAEGALAGNVALSRKRAVSVRDRLIEDYSVPAAQVTAEGVGFLAPRASNLTEEGRTMNRRVEVMLTSTQ
jgi:outer membrane protein OmpA-like peptidoglycan-associated protein